MLQKFSKDHKYKFSKEQLKKDYGEKHFNNCIDNIQEFKSWVDYCEGKPIEVESEEDGWIQDEKNISEKGYLIAPQWCICVGRND